MQPPQLKRGLFGFTGPSVRLLLADRDRMFIRAAEQARTAEATAFELQAQMDSVMAKASEKEQRVVAAEAEAADLRTDRDATREELNRVAAQVGELRAELQDASLDAQEARAEVQGANAALGLAEERMRVAEERAAHREGDLAVLRHELGSARRDFLAQIQRARTAERRIEQLTAERDAMLEEYESELGGLAAELELARAAAPAPPPKAAPPTAQRFAAVEVSTEHGPGQVLDSVRERAEAEIRQAERTRIKIRQEVDRLAEWRAQLAPAALAVRAAIAETKLRANRVGDGVRDALDPVSDAIAALGARLDALSELSAAAAPADSESWISVIELEEREQVQDEASDAPASRGWSR
jgi:hypothetical protein